MTETPTCDGHTCTCGQATTEPVLVASEIPAAIRHGAILGAVAELKPGTSMILVAPHDPVPLLTQIKEKEGESITVEYVEAGPGWKLRLARV